MSAPPFKDGDRSDVAPGVYYRVVPGRKGPTDLRLDVRTEGWVAAPMGLGFILADFFFQNEERLYPQTYGFEGGNYYLRYEQMARRQGWRQAMAELRAEREKKRRKDAA